MEEKITIYLCYHPEDEAYKNQFREAIRKAVGTIHDIQVGEGELREDLKEDAILQQIRDRYLKDSVLTIVLVGEKTWGCKYVDWEISASIRPNKKGEKNALMGILLPNHDSYKKKTYHHCKVPQRLHDNEHVGYARVFDWEDNYQKLERYIREVFRKQTLVMPDNTLPLYKRDRIGKGWC